MTGQDIINYIQENDLEDAEILDDLIELPFAVDLPNGDWLKIDPFKDCVKHFGNEENWDFCECISLEEAMSLRRKTDE